MRAPKNEFAWGFAIGNVAPNIDTFDTQGSSSGIQIFFVLILITFKYNRGVTKGKIYHPQDSIFYGNNLFIGILIWN